MAIKSENVIYQGTFNDVAAGQQLAASMFDKGVKVIHAAAGGVGVGVISEAKTRRSTGKDVWVVGVDVDQYNEGMMPNKKSAVLTSAMKFLDRASYDMIKAELAGQFPGGKELEFTANNDGVGIPLKNPNLSAEAQKRATEAFEAIKSGKVIVADNPAGLIK